MRRPRRLVHLAACLLPALLLGGCATIRVTDPPRTATELFLLNLATERAVERLNLSTLRDREVFVSQDYVFGPTRNTGGTEEGAGGLFFSPVSEEQSYVLGEVRARLLTAGAKLVPTREEAEVIAEIRVQALGVDKLEYIFGLPAIAAPGSEIQGVPLLVPELAFLKKLNQQGYSAIGLVAYWRDNGELLDSVPIELGRTSREDFWIFGIGPRTVGDIPPANE